MASGPKTSSSLEATILRFSIIVLLSNVSDLLVAPLPRLLRNFWSILQLPIFPRSYNWINNSADTICPKAFLNSKPAKRFSPITYFSDVQSFWNFAQDMPGLLPCSMKHWNGWHGRRRFREIWVQFGGIFFVETTPWLSLSENHTCKGTQQG